jgi:hypothetical protein
MEIFGPVDADRGMDVSANIQQINLLFTLCMAFFWGQKKWIFRREYVRNYKI